jgi:hypothetical protein
MKKTLFMLVLGLSLGLVRCVGPDCGPFPRPELMSVEADLVSVGATEETHAASDLRLTLSLDVIYVTQLPLSMPSLFQTAWACSPPSPSGFDDEISELSLICDKPIRGFAPGENILTTSADVFWMRQDDGSKTPITLGQWLELMNDGKTASSETHYDTHYDWLHAYDVSIAFIPEGTATAAGDYAFTLTLEMQSGTRYTETFAPVTLAAL